MNCFSWIGSDKDFVDERYVQRLDRMILGRFGGNSLAGQYKNEDGCLIWLGEEWELVAIFDAHQSAESAELVIRTLEQHKETFLETLSSKGRPAFKRLEQQLLEIFQSDNFLNECRKVSGETAFLVSVRKENYIWWLSIGDCLLYAFHPELMALNQYQLNQRQFFEWVGKVNTFEKTVPCYTSGIRELRKGTNLIFMTTDGLVECPGDPFADPQNLVAKLKMDDLENSITQILLKIERLNVRDSTTIVAWTVKVDEQGSVPSDA